MSKGNAKYTLESQCLSAIEVDFPVGTMAWGCGSLFQLVLQELWLSKTLPYLHVVSQIDQGSSI